MTVRIGNPDADTVGTVYDLEIAVAGETFTLRRSHQLMRRLEQVAGPLGKLAQRLSDGDITQSDLARVYRVLIEDEPVGPSPAAIDAWLFATGTAVAARAIALDVMSLTAGNSVLRMMLADEQRHAARNGIAPEEPDPEDAQRSRPFSPAAP